MREYSWINTYFQKNILNQNRIYEGSKRLNGKKNGHQKCPDGRC